MSEERENVCVRERERVSGEGGGMIKKERQCREAGRGDKERETDRERHREREREREREMSTLFARSLTSNLYVT